MGEALWGQNPGWDQLILHPRPAVSNALVPDAFMSLMEQGVHPADLLITHTQTRWKNPISRLWDHRARLCGFFLARSSQ